MCYKAIMLYINIYILVLLNITNMVLIHIKHGDESQFLFEASLETLVDECTLNITSIYNGRLKISRICCGNYQLSFFIIFRLFIT